MIIFSDPHLGLNRQAHTTKASRQRLAQRLSAVVREIHPTYIGEKSHTLVCCGDLFDKFSNSEETIADAAKAAAKCDVILAGNHDSLNQRDVIGSLDLVSEFLPDVVIRCPDFGTPFVQHGRMEGADLAFIPHHANQELFDAAIAHACSLPQSLAVFLHCNYENAMAGESDTSLNLTREQAEALLGTFRYIFIGHEHQPRELLGGRLIITGNVHPTSFSDISDKFVWELDTDTHRLTKHKVWSLEHRFAELPFDGETFKAIPDADFIDVTGTVTADKGADLAEYLSEVWERSGALMVRNSVVVQLHSGATIGSVDFENLPSIISDELRGTDKETLWNKYRGMV